MPRPHSADEDEGDEGAAEREAEFQRLQREYRNMVGDRAAYTEQTQNSIRKQRYYTAHACTCLLVFVYDCTYMHLNLLERA